MPTPARKPAPDEEPEGSPTQWQAGWGRIWSALLKKHGRDVMAAESADESREAEHGARQGR